MHNLQQLAAQPIRYAYSATNRNAGLRFLYDSSYNLAQVRTAAYGLTDAVDTCGRRGAMITAISLSLSIQYARRSLMRSFPCPSLLAEGKLPLGQAEVIANTKEAEVIRRALGHL